MNKARFQFRRRHIFGGIAAIAIILCVLLWLHGQTGDVRAAARAYAIRVRNDYQQGRITLEEARQKVGDQVDEWEVTTPHDPSK